MIKPLTRILGRAKPIKIRALTRIIPAREVKKELKNFMSMFIPIIPPWMLEFEDERQYLVPKSLFNVLVEDRDIDDWNYLLERFNNLLANLTKVLNNIRKIDYQRIVSSKLLEKEIANRRIKLTEKLLEKENENKVQKKSRLTSDQKIDNLMASLAAMGFKAVDPSSYNAPPAASNFTEIAERLMNDYGLEDFQAAAIVGTWMNEGLGKGRPDDIEDAYAAQYGDFGPPPIGSTYVGYGWAQYTNMAPGGRLDTVANAIGVTDRPWTNEDNFNAFAYELQNKFPALIDDLLTTTTLDEATELFVSVYEAGGNIQNFVTLHGPDFLPRRIRAAASVLNGMNKNKAAGAILIPEIFNNSFIWYNTDDKTSDISKFIVDKPTIIDTQKIGEPLVIIPVDRPIGRSILSLIFKEPFRKIEQMFLKKQEPEKEQTPIKNNTTTINRTTIPQSPKQEKNPQKTLQQTAPELFDILYPQQNTFSSMLDFDMPEIDTPESTSNFAGLTLPPLSSLGKKSNIDTLSQKTDNIFGPKVILITQDIYATEE